MPKTEEVAFTNTFKEMISERWRKSLPKIRKKIGVKVRIDPSLLG